LLLQYIFILQNLANYRKKKEYLITDEGRAVFEAEKARLNELVKNAALMEGNNND